MHLEETPEQLQLREELRTYFAQLLTPEVRKSLDTESEGGASFRKLVRQMGHDGWLGIGWPVEYGGQGRPATDQFIFFTEVQRARAPFPFVTLSTVGPMLINHGTEEQRKFFLPGILAGEINFAIGYTEPGAGTDLASLRTRAVLDGDEWVINGNKIFTSGADQADYIWLACRTDPEAPKHKGISIFLVPTDVSRLLVHPDRDGRRRGHHRLVLRGRPGPEAKPSSGSCTVGGVSSPASSTTSGSAWPRSARWPSGCGTRWPPGSSTRVSPRSVGSRRTWPGPTRCSTPRSS